MNVQRTIKPPPSGKGGSYDADFLVWTEEQAEALRTRDLSRIDWDNLIEEVESLGKSQRKELTSRITVVLVHLLKHEYGLDRRPSAKWRTTLLVQREEVSDLLQTNPSLRREVAGIADRKYAFARARALSEFQEYEPDRNPRYEEVFPKALPYTAEQVLDSAFFPETPAA